MIDWKALSAPFAYEDIDWRILRSGEKDGKPWAVVAPYVDSRAVMDRLDSVVGPAGWQVTYTETTAIGEGLQCHLKIKVDNEWIEKCDGAESARSDAGQDGVGIKTKATYSDALKRAAVLWGIGRHLYSLPTMYANIHPGGKRYQPAKKNVPQFKWDPPGPDMFPPGTLPAPRNNGKASTPFTDFYQSMGNLYPDPAAFDNAMTVALSDLRRKVQSDNATLEHATREELRDIYKIAQSRLAPKGK